MSDEKNVVSIRRPKRQKISHETAIQTVLDSGVKKLVIIGENADGNGVTIFSNELSNAEMIFLIEYGKIAMLMGED
jgi:hypothetical protein